MPIRGTLSVRDRPMPGRRASPSGDSEPSESHGRVASRGRNRGSSSRGTHRGNSTSPDLLVHRPWLEPGGGSNSAPEPGFGARLSRELGFELNVEGWRVPQGFGN